MKAYQLAAIAAVTLVVASCGGSKPTTDADSATAASATPSMRAMAEASPAATAKEGKGTGTVTAIDAAAGTITLDHGPIPEIGWPAMTMTFKAASAVTGAAAVGDKVAFEVRTTGMDSEVIALRKQ